MSESVLADLRRDLEQLDPSLRERLRASGFDPERLVELARPIAAGGDANARRTLRNRVPGEVSAPRDGELLTVPTGEALASVRAAGERALARGEVAFCVMAGGMATRMGGVVKAMVEVSEGLTFLDLRLRENAWWSHKLGRPVPLWLMTSDATDATITSALRDRKAPPHVKTFMQDIGLRLTTEGRLFREDKGGPSIYGTGHGDLVDAVRRSGHLRDFREAGGKYVWIANLDNLGASLDPAILGLFLDTEADVMVEVVDKAPGDKGGIPVHAQGRLQVLEEFRLPEGFDATTVPVFNTNTFLVRAEPLETARIAWNWFEVEKKVGGQVAVQFERLLQELTAAMPAAYARVPRDGLASRFLPVKDHEELARRRADIEAVARARGML